MTQPPTGSPSNPDGSYPPSYPGMPVPPEPYGSAHGGIGQPSWAPPPESRNGLGLAAMVLGIIGLVLGIVIIGIVPSILAVIFGIIGLRRANRGAATNRGQALAGLILGIVGIIFGAVIAVIGVTTVMHRYQDCDKKYDTNSRSFDHCIRGDAGY